MLNVVIRGQPDSRTSRRRLALTFTLEGYLVLVSGDMKEGQSLAEFMQKLSSERVGYRAVLQEVV